MSNEKQGDGSVKDIFIILFKQWRALLGIFRAFYFSFRYNYINFLHVYEGNSENRLEYCLYKLNNIFARQSIPKIIKATKTLLNSFDWRHHIVACAAIAKLPKKDQKLFIPILWNKLKKEGSWVSPQILGLLAQLDNDFIQHCKKHLINNELDYNKFKGNTISQFVEFLNFENPTKDYFEMVLPEWGAQVLYLVNKPQIIPT